MTVYVPFQGFHHETVSFFRKLKRNNNKAWFDNHRNDYEHYVLEPAKAFVVAMGEKLKRHLPAVKAEPKLNRSIFRIYRDTRFSPDKTPYKTHLGLFFWEGAPSRMECPGFYFHLESDKLILGAGIYMFSPKSLTAYRKAVVDPELGLQLRGIIKKIERVKGFQLGGKQYKRVPSGYDPGHSNADLLLHNSLHAGYESQIPEELFSNDIVDFCWQKFRPFIPLHKWLVSLVTRQFRSRP
ncbi:MAG: DUF2461 domain-containing protein [Candidatus Aminicenantes bacterium]|nr:DUF2461 domain-containing protein [Candidatus Aminicenantes bacterium]